MVIERILPKKRSFNYEHMEFNEHKLELKRIIIYIYMCMYVMYVM